MRIPTVATTSCPQVIPTVLKVGIVIYQTQKEATPAKSPLFVRSHTYSAMRGYLIFPRSDLMRHVCVGYEYAEVTSWCTFRM